MMGNHQSADCIEDGLGAWHECLDIGFGQHQNEFFALTQAQYTTLVGSEHTTPAEMLVALNQLLTPHTAN